MNKLELDLIRQALTLEELDDYQSAARRIAENSRAIPTRVAEGVDLSALLLKLAEGVAPRLTAANEAAASDRREKNAAEMPWVHKTSAKDILLDIERLQWYNDRIATFAAQMAAKHSLMGQLLAAQKLAALSVIERNEQELGKVLMTFVRRLKGAKLKAESVKDLPNAVLAALVAALNGEADNDLADALGISAKERGYEDAGGADDDLDALQKQIAVLKAEVESFSHYRDLKSQVPDEPPVHLQPDEWDYENGDLPRERWSAIHEPVQYRFEDRPAIPEEASTVLGMPLPAAHDWATLFERDADFRKIALVPFRNQRGGQNSVRDLFAERFKCDPDAVEDNVVRVWLFLLAGRQMEPDKHDRLFKPAYFDGVMMPLASITPNMVRVLRWIGDE
jgi:hypothetical protein